MPSGCPRRVTKEVVDRPRWLKNVQKKRPGQEHLLATCLEKLMNHSEINKRVLKSALGVAMLLFANPCACISMTIHTSANSNPIGPIGIGANRVNGANRGWGGGVGCVRSCSPVMDPPSSNQGNQFQKHQTCNPTCKYHGFLSIDPSLNVHFE